MDVRSIRIAEHSYRLPEERIARFPLADRDAAKLLVYRDAALSDAHFRDLPSLLPAGSLMVMNDTRVVHARLVFRRSTGARVECMLMRPANARRMDEALSDRATSDWWCMVGNAKRWKGEALTGEGGGDGLEVHRLAEEDGLHLLRFAWHGEQPFLAMLEARGHVPLPPYMRREAVADDGARYNTVFGDKPGSVAAPTASLHFTPGLLQRLAASGVRSCRVTLHVGAGTFLPVKTERMGDHHMHTEQLRVGRDLVRTLLDTVGKAPVVPVGTTALRTIESLYWAGVKRLAGVRSEQLEVQQWDPYGSAAEPTAQEALGALLRWMDEAGSDELLGNTGLLIAPGYRFRIADGLITNFHQPGSTLLLLVAAFVGGDWTTMYQHALDRDYRFLSYGDGSLLWRNDRPLHEHPDQP